MFSSLSLRSLCVGEFEELRTTADCYLTPYQMTRLEIGENELVAATPMRHKIRMLVFCREIIPAFCLSIKKSIREHDDPPTSPRVQKLQHGPIKSYVRIEASDAISTEDVMLLLDSPLFDFIDIEDAPSYTRDPDAFVSLLTTLRVNKIRFKHLNPGDHHHDGVMGWDDNTKTNAIFRRIIRSNKRWYQETPDSNRVPLVYARALLYKKYF